MITYVIVGTLAVAFAKVVFDSVVYAAAKQSFANNRRYHRMHECDYDQARKIMRLNGTLIDYDEKSMWGRFWSLPPIELAMSWHEYEHVCVKK